MRIYWVDEKLAGSSLPSLDDLNSISSTFNSVISLPEDWEFLAYGGYRVEDFVARLSEKGVKVVRLPTRDGFPPDDVVYSARLVESLVRQGRVLVHCVGGSGRTPTLIAIYLVMCRGMGVEDALRLLESLNPWIEISEVQYYAIIEAEVARKRGIGCI